MDKNEELKIENEVIIETLVEQLRTAKVEVGTAARFSSRFERLGELSDRLRNIESDIQKEISKLST